MVCTPHNLSILAYANGFTLWHYVTNADFYSDVIKPGYFDNGKDMLRERDAIIVNCADMNTTLFVEENDGSSPVRVRRGA